MANFDPTQSAGQPIPASIPFYQQIFNGAKELASRIKNLAITIFEMIKTKLETFTNATKEVFSNLLVKLLDRVGNPLRKEISQIAEQLKNKEVELTQALKNKEAELIQALKNKEEELKKLLESLEAEKTKAPVVQTITVQAPAPAPLVIENQEKINQLKDQISLLTVQIKNAISEKEKIENEKSLLITQHQDVLNKKDLQIGNFDRQNRDLQAEIDQLKKYLNDPFTSSVIDNSTVGDQT